jgi:hypothetical protein
MAYGEKRLTVALLIVIAALTHYERLIIYRAVLHPTVIVSISLECIRNQFPAFIIQGNVLLVRA